MEEEKKSGIRKVNINTLNLKSRGRGASNKKQKPGLWDNPQDRHYWTDEDNGIALEIVLTKAAIIRSLRKGAMLDVKNSHTAAHLNHKHILELIKFQFDAMMDIASENEANIFTDVDGDGIVMVDYNAETNQYEFVFAK